MNIEKELFRIQGGKPILSVGDCHSLSTILYALCGFK
jgi:hypothetical protein